MKWTEYLRALRERMLQRRPDFAEPIAQDVVETPYYRERSVGYATAQMIILLVLAVFLAASLLTGSARLSMENWTLLISDLSGAVVLPETGGTESLTYRADEANRFVSYRGGLAVLGQDRLTLFTASGRENYSVALGYHDPQLLSTGKALIAWDRGGTRLAAYHSFSKLFDTTTSSPIRDVSASESGYLCVVTDDNAYASCVTLYDADFDMISRIHLKEHTVCTAVSADGEQMAAASVFSKDGQLQLSLLLLQPGMSEPHATQTFFGVYPVSMQYTKDALLLLCTDRVLVLDAQGQTVREVPFAAEDLLGASLDANGCILNMRANNYNADTRVLALDASGEIGWDVTLTAQLVDAALSQDGVLYVLCENSVSLYERRATQSAGTLALRASYQTLLPAGEDEVFLCGEAKAVCVRLEREE